MINDLSCHGLIYCQPAHRSALIVSMIIVATRNMILVDHKVKQQFKMSLDRSEKMSWPWQQMGRKPIPKNLLVQASQMWLFAVFSFLRKVFWTLIFHKISDIL